MKLHSVCARARARVFARLGSVGRETGHGLAASACDTARGGRRPGVHPARVHVHVRRQ